MSGDAYKNIQHKDPLELLSEMESLDCIAKAMQSLDPSEENQAVRDTRIVKHKLQAVLMQLRELESDPLFHRLQQVWKAVGHFENKDCSKEDAVRVLTEFNAL